jgi:hypothetical protein
VSLDSSGIKNGVKNGDADLQKLQKAGLFLGDTLGKVGRGLTIGLTLPIAALGAASIKAAASFEETKNKSIVVFEDMSDGIIANANKSASALGIGKQKYLDYASSLGAAFKAGGLSVKESAELAESSVKHMADLVSFHDANIQDVSRAWESAVRGQYESIQRYFPFINNEFIKRYGIENGLLDASTQNLTANQRAIILNAIALDEKLNPALNDFAETSGSLTNQARSAKEQFGDLLITLGQNFLPIATQLVTTLNGFLEKLNQMSPSTQKMLINFLLFLAVLGPLATGISKIISLFSFFSTAASALSGLGISFAGIGTAISTVAVPALAALGAALLPILAVLAAVIATVAILALAWKFNFLGMRDNWTAGLKIMKDVWQAFTSFLKGDSEGAIEYLQDAWSTFVDLFNKNFERVFGIQNAWEKFMNFMRDALGRLVSYIRDTFSRVDWGQVGRYILTGLANGMLLGLPTLLSTAAKIADDLLGTIKKKLGIASDSTEAIKLGYFTSHGFLTGMQRVSPEDMARSLVRPITNTSASQQQTIIQNFSSGLTVSQARSMIAENNEQLINTMIGALNG